MTKRVLTGINTTGTLHIGNYVGAIRPAIRDSRNPDVQSFFFLADLHSLIKCQDPARIERSRRQIAATWLAAGLDPDKVVFYRQSDIPEIPTLNWLLTCCTAKGQMNRAHAYKAATDAAVEAGRDPDSDVSMGLYCYPILMAADILMFNADEVPVGHDQLQHLEMARDVATRFNYLYAKPDAPFFTMPQATGGSDVEVLPGLDGRKMSKSYNNVIPLFEAAARRSTRPSRASSRTRSSRANPRIPTAIRSAFSTRPSPRPKSSKPSRPNSARVSAGVKPRSVLPTRSTPKSARCASVTKNSWPPPKRWKPSCRKAPARPAPTPFPSSPVSRKPSGFAPSRPPSKPRPRKRPSSRPRPSSSSTVKRTASFTSSSR